MNLGYHSKFDDEELYYYRARYYDPTTQRFLSQDPIRFNSGDFNFYRYVWNSPGNFTDPSGLDALFYGPFGGLCGEEGTKTATWIPDISPDACKTHDKCYSDCSKTQRQCDLEFFRSNPYYGIAVIFSGKAAYDSAQGKAKGK